MTWYEGLVFSMLVTYIVGNVVCTIIFFKSATIYETIIDDIFGDSDMNIFGKILASITAFIFFSINTHHMLWI